MAGQHHLALDLFLIAHDPFNGGRLRISTELLGCGLVGAELADLMLSGRLGFDDDDLVVVRDPDGPPDEVDDYVMEAVASQADHHPVRAWIEPLQDGLYALIGQEAVASRVVRHQSGGRRLAGGRQPDRFPAVDLLAACRPQQNLEARLRAPRDLTLATGTLAVLIGAIGGDRLLDPEIERVPLRELLVELEQNLPSDLRAVYDGMRAVIGEVSLRAR